MKEKKDYFSYFIGIAGLVLAIISFFNREDQKLVFLVWGAAALVVAVVMIYVGNYRYQLDSLESQVQDLKREYGFSEQVRSLKEEVEKLKNEQKRKIH